MLRSKQSKVMLNKVDLHLHFQKSDDETVQKFNDGLKKIEGNGELAKIGKKWFGQDVSKSK